MLGFDGVPEAGEHVRAVENERRARQLAGERATRLKAESLARRSGKQDLARGHLRGRASQELNLVLKADVAGSLEAIEDEIAKLPAGRGVGQRDPPRRRRRDRVRRDARRGLRRRDPRLQRAPGGRRPRGRRARGRRDPPLLGDLPRDRGAARARCRACSRPRRSRRRSAPPRCARSSAPRASGRSPARTSPTARSPAARKVRLVRDGTVVYDGEIASLRRFNEDAREVAAGLRLRHRAAGLRRHQGRRRARGLHHPSGRARARLTELRPECRDVRGAASSPCW